MSAAVAQTVAAPQGTILHVFDHSFPVGDGYAFRSGEILRFTRRAGWATVHVTSAKQGRCGAPLESAGGFEFYRTSRAPALLDRVPVGEQWRVVTTLRERLQELVDEHRPHLLHVHSPCLNGLAALPVARRAGIPLVYEMRSLWEDAAVDSGVCRSGGLRYRASRALETYVCRRSDRVVTICEGLRQELISRGLPLDRIIVAPNSVDLQRFSSDASREKGVRGGCNFGFIGTFFPFEGLDVLLRAVPQMLAHDPGVRFVLVGDGPELPRLRTLAADLGVGDAVQFTGRVPHAEVQAWYEQLDILVYPRISTRLTELVTPLKPLEAMALGKLVVASDIGGHREMVFHGCNGVLFEAGRPESIAERCLDLLRSPQRWPELRRNAREYVSTARSWEVTARTYDALYRDLICGAPAHPGGER